MPSTRPAAPTAAEIQNAIPDPPSYSAVTLLRILEDKGARKA